MFRFQLFTEEEKEQFITHRPNETRIGEKIICGDNPEKVLENPNIEFVLIGAPEDTGVRANCGIGGAATAWASFLKSFLNIQDTPFLSGENFLLYGYLNEVKSPVPEPNYTLTELRVQTALIDEVLFPVIQKIILSGKIPIIIGGGHNNAFPNLKGASLALEKPVNAINIDAHADFRATEGRHSGNGFSYAFQKGYLKQYFALGLHEAYNSAGMMQSMSESPKLRHIYWEDIFLRKKLNWTEAVQNGIQHISNEVFGVEMDVDCIENVLSSAATPVGIQPREAMEALYTCGKNPNSIYLHLPEAVARRKDGIENPLTGKTLSYLVQAFAKGVLER